MKDKYKLQYFDKDANAWTTFYSYNDLIEALSYCPGLAASKFTNVRIIIEVDVVIYDYPEG